MSDRLPFWTDLAGYAGDNDHGPIFADLTPLLRQIVPIATVLLD